MTSGEIIGRIVAVIIGYCFGMILMGYLIGKSKNIDLTKVGSGNVGSTNTMRNLGVPAGLITLLWDCTKCIIIKFNRITFILNDFEIVYIK